MHSWRPTINRYAEPIRRFRRMSGALGLGWCLCLIPCVTGEVTAGTIEALVQINGTLTNPPSLPVVIETDSQNNESVAATANSVSRDTEFFSWTVSGHINPIDFVFKVKDSSGVTEYSIFQLFTNATDEPWSKIEYALGFGTGAGFAPADPILGLDFDCPSGLAAGEPCPKKPIDELSSLQYQHVHQTANKTEWSDGSTAIGMLEQSLLAIDVPDQSPGIPAPYRMSDGYEFTLRVRPVPEPSTLWTVGLMGLLGSWRRRS